MPILDYGMLLGPGALYRAQLMVRTVMAWPADEARRRQYMATVMSMHLAELEEAGANLPDPASGESWEDTIEAIEHAEDWHASVEQLGGVIPAQRRAHQTRQRAATRSGSGGMAWATAAPSLEPR